LHFYFFYLKRNLVMDAKAIAYVRRQAPLADPVRSDLDHARLIKRGFKVTYTGIFNSRDGAPTLDGLRFGFQDSIKEEGHFDGEDGYPVNFTMVGLPPARGTRVWLATCSPYFNWPAKAQVFATKEEALDTENVGADHPFMGFMDEGTDEDIELVISDLRQGVTSDYQNQTFAVFSVQLP